MILRALAHLLHRQAFPDFRELDADWERRTNRMTTDLHTEANRLDPSKEDVL